MLSKYVVFNISKNKQNDPLLKQLKLLIAAASHKSISVWFCQFLYLLEGTKLFKLLDKDSLQSWLPQR